jgi:hypothetical protein
MGIVFNLCYDSADKTQPKEIRVKLRRVKISFEILVNEDDYDEGDIDYHIFNGIPDMFGVNEIETYTLETEVES